jgi:glyoxylase-like metal-dependent hydrolase (beta-lactamase superfamily II)
MKAFAKYTLLSAVLAVIAACSGERRPAGEEPALRLYVLDCGKIDVLDTSFFSPGVNEGESRTLANACYLVVHPRGTLLWDTGLPDALADVTEADTVLGNFVMHIDHPLAAQLTEIGHAPETIQYLGLSHMHFDHVGNVDLLPQATLLIQQEEYDAAFGPEAARYFFDPRGYSTLRRNPVEVLRGEHDVFGDGSVIIRRAPGHTPGHQALFVHLARSGGVLLSGDLVHFSENFEHKRVPGSNFDHAQSLATMQETEAFLAATGTRLWIQHDPVQWGMLLHAPSYYE